ncbi:hypothetical protein [Qipengyuania sphaerica]|uniref:hypothetical protein n=1 Tax=Qipengyuania sphaerica TaxID=2867243 RepID=UPI001C8817B0|nr:hypothetical protein [Qipengyuania sphaerica]MBX7539528.1 hypothetical protein [Qipengyuania sphaerica]
MYEEEGDTAHISFQWVVGDTKAHEQNVREMIGFDHSYAIAIFSRVVAFVLTYFVAKALLPDTDFFVLIWIVLAASLSIWVSLGVEIFLIRMLERLQAVDPKRVGWNSVWLDSSGVSWSTETSEDYTSWLGVIDVIEQEGSLWIKTGPAHGYYIPPRVFASVEELTNCKKLIEKLRNDPVPPKHLVGTSDGMVKH